MGPFLDNMLELGKSESILQNGAFKGKYFQDPVFRGIVLA